MPQEVVQIERALSPVQQQKKIFRGVLGMPGETTVASANRPTYHWVQLAENQRKVVLALNTVTPPTYGLAVLVEEEKHPRTGSAVYSVIGLSTHTGETFGAQELYVISGSPDWETIADGNGHGAGVWALSDSSTTIIGTAFGYLGQQGGNTIYVDVWYSMASASSGNVVLQAGVLCATTGEAGNGTAQTGNLTSAVPGSVGQLKKASIAVSATYAIDDMIRLSVGRLGGNGSDTASGACYVWAVTVRFG